MRAAVLVTVLFASLVLGDIKSAIVGGFTSYGPHHVGQYAAWRAGEGWVPLYQEANTVPATSVLTSAGDAYWIAGSSNRITAYKNSSQPAPAGGVRKIRVGNADGTFTGSLAKLAVNPTGSSLYFCGSFSEIGNVDTTYSTPQLYEVTDPSTFAFTLITPESSTTQTASCSTLLSLGDAGLYIVASDGYGYIRQSGSWTRAVSTGSIGSVNGSPMIRVSGTTVFAYLTDTTLGVRTVQKWSGSGDSWQPVIAASFFDDENADLHDFQVGANEQLYLKFSDGDFDYADVFVFVPVGSAPFTDVAPVAKDFVFGSGSSAQDDFEIFYDPNVGLVAYGVTTLWYAGRNDSGHTEWFAPFYSKPLANAAVLVASSDPANDAAANWQPVYGGGFSSAPSSIVAFSGVTYFLFGSTTFVYDTYTGPVAVYDSDTDAWGAPTFSNYLTNGFSPFEGATGYFPGSSSYGLTAVQNVKDLGLVVTGRFRTVNRAATTVNSIVAFSDNGVRVFGTGLDVGVRYSTNNDYYLQQHQPAVINAFYVDTKNDYVYVAGSFDTAGAISASNVARYNYKDNTWTDLRGGVDGTVYDVERFGDWIVFAGSFNRAGRSLQTPHIAAWNTKTEQWVPLNRGVNDAVYDLATWKGRLVAVGALSSGSNVDGTVLLWDDDAWHSIAQYTKLGKNSDCQTEWTCTAPSDLYQVYVWGSNFYTAGADISYFSKSKGWASPNFSSISVYAKALMKDPASDNLIAWVGSGSETSGRTDFERENGNTLYTTGGVNGNVANVWPASA